MDKALASALAAGILMAYLLGMNWLFGKLWPGISWRASALLSLVLIFGLALGAALLL